ncbi:MAG: hypothetical protein AMXMBFR64_21310 [Myxococcales bacterium]
MSMNKDNGVTRRGFITGLAAGTAVIALARPGVASPASSIPSDEPSRAEPLGSLQDLSAPLRDVLAVLTPGATVLPGWSIANVGTRTGAVAVFLRSTEGAELRVDVCRRDADRQSGVVRTEHFELVLMNHGEGQAVTPQEHEQAARVIGEALRRVEGRLTAAPSELATHERRVALFQNAVLFHPEPARRA